MTLTTNQFLLQIQTYILMTITIFMNPQTTQVSQTMMTQTSITVHTKAALIHPVMIMWIKTMNIRQFTTIIFFTLHPRFQTLIPCLLTIIHLQEQLPTTIQQKRNSTHRLYPEICAQMMDHINRMLVPGSQVSNPVSKAKLIRRRRHERKYSYQDLKLMKAGNKKQFNTKNIHQQFLPTYKIYFASEDI